MSDTLTMLPGLPGVEVAQATDPGKDPDKQVNEDTCRYAETAFGHLVVLCDGMGGHEGGKEASEKAVESVFRYVHAAAPRPDLPQAARAREVLRDAIAAANREVFGLVAGPSATRPGSTIVALLVHAGGAEVAHVGDSRCYLVHAGAIRQVTSDHSMVQQLVDAGKLTAAEAAVHPDANRITRALGMAASVGVDVQPSSVLHVEGDTFVLCSDGLSDLVGALEVARIVTASPPAAAVKELVDLANARGGHDNVTVAVVRALVTAHASTGEPVSATAKTETMAVFPGHARRPPASVPPPASSGSSRRAQASTIPPAGPPDSHPLLPPAPPPSQRAPRRLLPRPPTAVLIGLVLAAIGVAAVAAVLTLQVAPRRATHDVPEMALSVVLPAASLIPGARPMDDDIDAGVDASRGRRFHNPKRR